MATKSGKVGETAPGQTADVHACARWHRLGRLPPRARVAGLVLLGCGTAPPLALLGAAAWESPLAARLWAQPVLVNLIACCVAVAALLAFERPRSASPLVYARQLRVRFLELQSTYDAGSRRRPDEGKEKEDDLDVSSEP